MSNSKPKTYEETTVPIASVAVPIALTDLMYLHRRKYIEVFLMNRPQKVKEIYVELRRALGPEAKPSELLECAAMLVSISEKQVGLPRCSTSEGRTPFEELPLDQLYSRWPWRLVSQEYRVEDEYEVREEPESVISQLCARAA